MDIKTGYKFFRFLDDDDNPEILRVITSDGITVEYFDSEKNKKKIGCEELVNNYTLLKPDGAMLFTIVNMNEKDKTSKDVIVALKNMRKDAKDSKGLPHVVCRQSIYDFFVNNLRQDPDRDPIYIGLSVSQDTCPSNIEFADVLSCTGLVYQRTVGVYLDDTLDSILELFSHKKFNIILETLSQTLRYQDNIPMVGHCHTLRELLENNKFMYDFRKCFRIEELPFEIGDADQLSEANVEELHKIVKENIAETYVTRFSKMIDLSALRRNYILATSAMEEYKNVYIIGYDTIEN